MSGSANKDVRYFENLEEKFNLYMDDYDVSRRQELIFSVLQQDVSISQKKVLEVGCGTGRISRSICHAKADLTVVDIGEQLVKKVSDELSCAGVAADACSLPFEDESFDVVISSECIEHTTDPCKALEEMCRVCKKGGYVCITTPNKIWYPVLWLSQKTGLRKFSGIENWIFPSKAKVVMKSCKVETIMIRGCHLWPFQLKFTRPLLTWFDGFSKWLYPLMINFGIIGRKL